MTGDAVPKARFGGSPDPQASLPLASDGVRRIVWQTATGSVLIEVRDGVAYVNGARVEPIAETLARGCGEEKLLDVHDARPSV